MKNCIRLVVLFSSIALLAGCDVSPKSSVGFTLPDGNVEQGQANYISLGCNACHSSAQVPQLEGDVAAGVSVELGGKTTRIRTYGELVTSIINPSHRVARRSSPMIVDDQGQSRMTTFNDTMTVTQLIDLVAYVQSLYELSPYKSTPYPVYWIPGEDEALTK